jgi:phosphoribosylamine--glycine ligase
MPPGVPVATMAVGKAGAKNAAILAAQIMGRKDKGVMRRLAAFRKKMAMDVLKRAESLEKTNK